MRHGQSIANAGGATTDPATIPLTELGHEQARKIAHDIGQAPDLIVSSPFTRAQQTAQPLCARYTRTQPDVWPIHEFTYLTPTRYASTTRQQRQPAVTTYWDRADLDYIDGLGAESFNQLAQRVRLFHQLLKAQKGFVVVFGHETFFRTYLLGLDNEFSYTAADMHHIGYGATPPRIANGEVQQLPATRRRRR